VFWGPLISCASCLFLDALIGNNSAYTEPTAAKKGMDEIMSSCIQHSLMLLVSVSKSPSFRSAVDP
jgi:hypothetical protein